MRILVTGQTFREFIVKLLAVWQNMTDAALWDVAMLTMATDTIDLAMLARCFAPLRINLVMAGVAGFGIGIFGECDL